MKKIIIVVLFCLPLCLLSQENTDDLNLANKILKINEENILSNPLYHNWGSSIIKGKMENIICFMLRCLKKLDLGLGLLME